MVAEEAGEKAVDDLLLVVGHADVLLLIDGLELGVEAADDHVFKTVALHLCPVLNLVRGDVLGVAGDVVRGVGVGAFGADGGHQLVVLVGDGNLAGLIADAVNLVIDGAALLGVGGLTIDLVKVGNLVEHGALGIDVLCAEVGGALEHQVLQIVAQAGGLGRVVLAAHADGDVSLDARSILVDGQIDLQAIVEGVDAGLHRVARYRFVGILLPTRCYQQHSSQQQRKTQN